MYLEPGKEREKADVARRRKQIRLDVSRVVASLATRLVETEGDCAEFRTSQCMPRRLRPASTAASIGEYKAGL